jgi:hypothetical protein
MACNMACAASLMWRQHPLLPSCIRAAAAGTTGNLSLTSDLPAAVIFPGLQLPHVVARMNIVKRRSSCTVDALQHSAQVLWRPLDIVTVWWFARLIAAVLCWLCCGASHC